MSPTTTREATAAGRHLLLSGATLVIAAASALVLFQLCWHRSPLADLHRQPGGWTGAFFVVISSAIVHELLHGLGWTVLGRAPRRAVVFRPSWRVMGFVARLDGPIPARAYRAGLASPALVMGAIPMVLGVVTGAGLWLVWALFFSLECFSDLAALFATQHVPKDAQVLSHPTKLGCQIEAVAAAYH